MVNKTRLFLDSYKSILSTFHTIRYMTTFLNYPHIDLHLHFLWVITAIHERRDIHIGRFFKTFQKTFQHDNNTFYVKHQKEDDIGETENR